MIYGTIVTPEIVIAIASLLFFVTIHFDARHSQIVIAHVVYNTTSLRSSSGRGLRGWFTKKRREAMAITISGVTMVP